MKFVLTIELGNDAMRSAADVAEALRHAGETLEVHGSCWPELTPNLFSDSQRRIVDANGNRVGAWDVLDAAGVKEFAKSLRYAANAPAPDKYKAR